jgi:uncharacterized OB-fold protein
MCTFQNKQTAYTQKKKKKKIHLWKCKKGTYCIPRNADHSNTAKETYVLLHFYFGQAVAQFVTTLRYKPENRGFDSPCRHWNFLLT